MIWPERHLLKIHEPTHDGTMMTSIDRFQLLAVGVVNVNLAVSRVEDRFDEYGYDS